MRDWRLAEITYNTFRRFIGFIPKQNEFEKLPEGIKEAWEKAAKAAIKFHTEGKDHGTD